MGVDDTMSNLTSAISNEASISSTSNVNEMGTTNLYPKPQPPPRKKRNLPGNPDPESEVVALSPRSLMATNRFVCEICLKGFQRDQNLQLHRRGHNLPWKLKQRSKQEVPKKKVYVCPEPSCVHHDPARALGDLTGIKKHFSRKHGEKKWKCEKCSKRYAVQSDWKAHSKICGTREYRCDCGTLFSRRDSFITHRAFCDALAQESSRSITLQTTLLSSQTPSNFNIPPFKQETPNFTLPPWLSSELQGNPNPNPNNNIPLSSFISSSSNSSFMSATALLQKAAQMGVTMSSSKMPPVGTTQPAYSEQSILIGPHLDHVGAPGPSTPPPVLPSRDLIMPGSGTPFLQDMPSFGANNKLVQFQDMNLMMSSSSSSSLAFDDAAGAFDAMMNPPRRNLGGDDFTRDFLGLRAFPHRNFVNMAGLDQMGSSSCDHQQAQNQAPWQS